MNKETLECNTNGSRSGDDPVGLSSSRVHLYGIDDHDVLDKARRFLDSYLRALNVPVEQRIRLCSKTVETIRTHKNLCATCLEPSQLIREVCALLVDEWQVDGSALSDRDPELASVESRLRIWFSEGLIPERQRRKSRLMFQDLKPAEMIIASPPINRAHMPTAKIELRPFRRMAIRIFNGLTIVRSQTLQTFRRFLVKMRFDAY